MSLEPRYADLTTQSFNITLLPAMNLTNVHEENTTQTETLVRHAASVRSGDNAAALAQEAKNICMYMHTSGSTGTLSLPPSVRDHALIK